MGYAFYVIAIMDVEFNECYLRRINVKPIDLNGKTALVTGGAGQIGRGIVRSLAQCGANVAIAYLQNQGFAQALKEETERNWGIKAHACQVDVTDFDSVQAMKADVYGALGQVDILVNCAVVDYNWEHIIDQDIKDFDSQYRSFVMQAVYMAKTFVPDMIQRRYGRIIAINTECVLQNYAYQGAYVAGKRGMDGIYRVLAKEVGPYGITVNQVAPGWTITDSCRNPDGTEANIRQDFPYIERVPLHRRGTEEDIANAVCFFASDLAAFITGAFLPVTGGNVMVAI